MAEILNADVQWIITLFLSKFKGKLVGLEAILNPMYAKDNFFCAKEIDVEGFAILSRAWPFFSEIVCKCN